MPEQADNFKDKEEKAKRLQKVGRFRHEIRKKSELEYSGSNYSSSSIFYNSKQYSPAQNPSKKVANNPKKTNGTVLKAYSFLNRTQSEPSNLPQHVLQDKKNEAHQTV